MPISPPPPGAWIYYRPKGSPDGTPWTGGYVNYLPTQERMLVRMGWYIGDTSDRGRIVDADEIEWVQR